MPQTVDSVLDYWFGPQHNGFPVTPRDALWWQGGADIDRDISVRFGATVEQALQGQLDAWQQTPRGRLALIIVLDQFTRNIYRGQAKAFAGDSQAYELTQQGLAQGADRVLSFSERLFFYMPLEHAENLAAQQQCIRLLETLKADVPSAYRAMIESNLSFAKAHAAVIEQFGRFVHRNAVLGRESTAQELEYLRLTPSRWGQ